MALLRGAAHEFGDFPCLRGAMAEVGVIGLALVGGVKMGAEHFGNIIVARPEPNAGAGNTLPYKPVPTEEGCWTAVQGVANHGRLLNRPFGEDNEATAENAAVVEFPIWQDVCGMAADFLVVFLREAFLQANNLGGWICSGKALGDLVQAFDADFGDVFKIPAIVCEKVYS